MTTRQTISSARPVGSRTIPVTRAPSIEAPF
jgi:hypothetical protein